MHRCIIIQKSIAIFNIEQNYGSDLNFIRIYIYMILTRKKSPSRCRTQYIEYNSQSCIKTSCNCLETLVNPLTASTNLITRKARQCDSAQCANSILVWFHASSGDAPLRILRSIFSVAWRILLQAILQITIALTWDMCYVKLLFANVIFLCIAIKCLPCRNCLMCLHDTC